MCKSTVIDSEVGSINSPRPVHHNCSEALGYLHYWHSIGCSNPPPGLTPVELLLINPDCFTGGLNLFASSSTSRSCNGTGVRALLSLDLMFKSTSRADPFLTVADQLRLTRSQAQSIVRARTPALGLIGIRMVMMVYGCKRGLE